MRRSARVDRNQKEIVDALRKVGASVLIVSQLKNCFDILVGYKGKTHIIEIKDGKLSPSKRKLTLGEQKFKDNWKGSTYHVVESIDDALETIKNH